MSAIFDIPPESPEHPDILCPALIDGEKCGVILRWCPECGGRHHITEMFWILQHYTREVFYEDGTGRFRFDMEKPCSVEEWTEALARVEGK